MVGCCGSQGFNTSNLTPWQCPWPVWDSMGVVLGAESMAKGTLARMLNPTCYFIERDWPHLS